ncbi:uncharacterized protein LOC106758043 [Vigna radiata var. radiata]|uniref:Uncharacterized protein LOC106758043 n=1 Tax=Vigna radiata var. radiata TaxID=3916 RepID=A0A1S3TRM7_VIGRR|nr:uncharacterized protein LOC106758043 [Vigna radiata var. radiata]
MAEEEAPRRRTLADVTTVVGPHHFNSIARRRVNATNMEVKPALIQLVKSNQFNGLSHENPYEHLTTFNEICNTVKINGVPDKAIKLSLFPFSLGGNAKLWLNSFPENSFTRWEDVKSKFLNKYFPQSKINKGLSSQTKLMLDASAGGNIERKTIEEAYELIENMTANDNEMHNERGNLLQQKGILKFLTEDALLAQNKLITQQLENLTKTISQLPEELKNVSQGNFNQGNYNQGWKNHPSIGQSQNGQAGQAGGQFNRPQQPPPIWQQVSTYTEKVSSFKEKLDKFMKVYESKVKSDEATFRDMHMQIDHLAKRVEEKEKYQFGANTKVNPREDCKVVWQKREERKYERFREIFNQMEITILLTEALQQIPVYARRIKHYLGEKIDLDEKATEEQEGCNDSLKKEHPPKVKDSGSFTIPYAIGSVKIGKTLRNLGSSINLMPLSMMKKIDGLTLKPTKISLIMADGSPKKPYGVMEDVVIRIERLDFLVDFVVIEMKEDDKI